MSSTQNQMNSVVFTVARKSTVLHVHEGPRVDLD